jgi:hypothetical protein
MLSRDHHLYGCSELIHFTALPGCYCSLTIFAS